MEAGELLIEEAKEDMESNADDDCECIYELTTVISHVFDPSKKASKHSHLVTQIKGKTKKKDFLSKNIKCHLHIMNYIILVEFMIGFYLMISM